MKLVNLKKMSCFNCNDNIFKDYLSRFRDGIRDIIIKDDFILEVITNILNI